MVSSSCGLLVVLSSLFYSGSSPKEKASSIQKGEVEAELYDGEQQFRASVDEQDLSSWSEPPMLSRLVAKFKAVIYG